MTPAPSDTTAKRWSRLTRRRSKATPTASDSSPPARGAAGDLGTPGDTAEKFAHQIRTLTLSFVGFYVIACPVLGFSLSNHWGREPFTITFAAVLIALAS